MGDPTERAEIRFSDDGFVDVYVGTQSTGQGHETGYIQLMSQRLGIDGEKIRVRQGDTDTIPVGGGTVLTAQRIVITQPQAGTYHAFTAICTHLGCIVNSVSGGTINCPCHGSKYSIVNGSVVNGPAPLPLAAVSIKVEGTSIVKA